MDIYWAHVAQYKHTSYTAPDGSVVTSIFDPAAVVAAQTMRFPLFHAKDGKIDTTQANGYVMAPFGQGDIDYSTFLRRVGAKGCAQPDVGDGHRSGQRPDGAQPVDGAVEGQLRRHGRPARLTRPTNDRSPVTRRRGGIPETPAPGERRCRCSGALPGDRLSPSLSRRTYR